MRRRVVSARALKSDSISDRLPRLRDPRFTKVLLVAVPEATPVHEAADLQADLRRAGIEPFAWVINQSFAGDEIRDPVLRERGSHEQRYSREVCDQLASRVAWVPWYPAPPVGPDRLLEFARGAEVEPQREACLADGALGTLDRPRHEREDSSP